MNIIAIDPGTTQSAVVQWDGSRIIASYILPNEQIVDLLRTTEQPAETFLCIEMIASYGMPVGRETFETCLWIGRFIEAWYANHGGLLGQLVYRRDIKLHHCGSCKAKDANIRQALIDKYGKQGTKKAPGITYGLKKDLWAAFALATMISETKAAVKEAL